MNIVKVFNIKGASQEFAQSPQLDRKGKDMVLRHDYEIETGEYRLVDIIFAEVIACKITKDICRELYMIESYDAVSVVKNSKWLNEIKNVYNGENIFNYNHYIVYFEDYGCYEFIAKSVSQNN